MYIVYLNKGGKIQIKDVPAGLRYRWVNPKTGEVRQEGKAETDSWTAPGIAPYVLIIAK